MPAKRSLPAVAAIFLIVGAGTRRSADAQPAFEVASVKPSTPAAAGNARSSVHGGPGSTDPEFARFDNVDLFSLVAMAYGVQRYQLSAPDWTNTTRFDVVAKLPPGATSEQYRNMLQGLLAERFRLVLHRESREMRIYELVIGRNGSKLTESAADPGVADDHSLQPPPRLPARPPMDVTGSIGVSIHRARMSIERLAGFLSDMLDQTVTDATGLTGLYDIELHGALDVQEAPSGGTPTIADALEEQLGLRLVRKKGLVDILKIDHLEKVPTDN
jgi:uncharacterized protein (TIGR03435 family)